MTSRPKTTPVGTTFMPATAFRGRLLELAHRVADTGEEIVLTVRGEPVAKLGPYHRRAGNQFIGAGPQNVRVTVPAEVLDALTSGHTPPVGATGLSLRSRARCWVPGMANIWRPTML